MSATESVSPQIPAELPKKPQPPNGRTVKETVKDKKFLWPVFVVFGILILVIGIAIYAEREKAKLPEVPKNTKVVTEVLPSKPTVPTAPKLPAPVSGQLSCADGYLHLNVPPLPPLKLYTRTGGGETFLQLTCNEAAPPVATNIIDQRVKSLETRVQELQEELNILKNPKKRAK